MSVLRPELAAHLGRGAVIPAHPLALTADRRLDERRQAALTRYYVAAGAGGVAVGVHSTQFAIREPRHGLLRPVLELASTTVDRVLALARDLKIDPKYVNATRVQIQPEYRWNENDRERVLLGYVVSRQVEIELRDLDKLGALLERVVDAGVNQVGDPMLDSSRRKELEREAMTKALEDARRNAEALARAAGAKLGQPRMLAASGGTPPVPMYRARLAQMDMAAAQEATYQAGDMKFSASVNAEYDLITGNP